MGFVVGKLKCCLCGKKDGLIRSVCAHGIYGEVGKRVYYHQECLEMIEAEPEKFGHKLIDKVLHINERIKRCERFNINNVDNFKKKVETLHRQSFERMMPTKP